MGHWNIHPGEILKEEFLEPLGITSYRLAKEVLNEEQAANMIEPRVSLLQTF